MSSLAALAATEIDPLHVTNGLSVVGTMRSTGLEGEFLSWEDVLYDGPVPSLPPAELRRVRAEHWGADGALSGLEDRDRAFDEALAGGRRVVLWFEHDLHDQLQLVQILARIAPAAAQLAPLEAIVIGEFPGRPRFQGLGELDPAELESLWPQRRPITADEVELGARAWDALCAPEPTSIETFLQRDTAALPFLAPALRRLLEELPDVKTGLSRLERQLLETLADGPRSRIELFLAMEPREEAPFAGDQVVWSRLEGLDPLVASGERDVALTDEGRCVLSGEADRVELLGIDRWLGGTHLRPGHVWRWDPAAARIVNSAR